MGLALPGYRIRTVDADDRDASEGEVCVELDPRPTGLV
jgi:acetyl-CoA synthetase